MDLITYNPLNPADFSLHPNNGHLTVPSFIHLFFRKRAITPLDQNKEEMHILVVYRIIAEYLINMDVMVEGGFMSF